MTAEYFADLQSFDWPARALHAFKNDGLQTFNQVLEMSDAELLRRPGFGHKTLKEVREIIRAAGWEPAHGPRLLIAGDRSSTTNAKEPLERIADALERIAYLIAMKERV